MQAYLFPGQGSQHRGMGRTLFDSVREYSMLEREADRIAGYSIRELCMGGPDSRLRETRYTQPCMFVVNALHYYDGISRDGKPAAVAGHSLGEYNALLAAGVFDFLTGLRLVQKRGELMASATNGAMAAVLNIPSDRVMRLIESSGLNALDVANYNSPSQTVIAGPSEQIAKAADIFTGSGAQYVRLPVSAAFHSRYMAEAAQGFERFLESFSFRMPTIPVVSNVTGRYYPGTGNADSIRSLLIRQITSPVRWVHGIQYLSQAGVSSFREAGPGVILSRLCQQIAPGMVVQ